MQHLKGWLLTIVLVFSIALLAGCTGQQEKVVKAGDNVTVDYTGWYDNGTIFDTSEAAVAQEAGIYSPFADAQGKYTPFSFVVGSRGIISGFGNATIGMKIGESKNVTLSPAEAYGEYDPSRIVPVPMVNLTRNNITPYVNQTLIDSYGRTLRVDSIPNNTTVMIDLNDPMAGKTLHFKITVRDIQPVTQ